jgi:pimeloyl-ACP methyl ester carboxylesterase
VEHVERAGLILDVRDLGPDDGEVVILLHGFPETSAAWDAVAPRLADAGYRVLAPDQRGYSPGARPAGRRAYAMEELEADALAVGSRAGADRFHVVGHDWGGAVAWALAAHHPDRVASLTAVSTPHPGAMQRAMLHTTQGLRSSYLLLFQLPWLPERLLLWRFEEVLRRGGLSAEQAEAYGRVVRQPGAMTAVLNWYRAIPLERRPPAPVSVPTTYVWSTGDRFLGRAAAELTAGWVTGPYRFAALEGVSHWIPEHAAAELADLILDRVRSV